MYSTAVVELMHEGEGTTMTSMILFKL